MVVYSRGRRHKVCNAGLLRHFGIYFDALHANINTLPQRPIESATPPQKIKNHEKVTFCLFQLSPEI